MHRLGRWFSLLVMVILSACTTTQTINNPTKLNAAHLATLSKIKQFTIKGRIGIQMPGNGYTGSFKWQHLSSKTDEISFFSPVGSQVAHITQTPQQASLKDNKGNTYVAANAAALIDEHLGWQIPVDDLNDWLLARVQPDVNTKIMLDENGRITDLKKNDWSIQYKHYHAWDGVNLPSHVALSKANFSLKLIIKDWQVNQ